MAPTKVFPASAGMNRIPLALPTGHDYVEIVFEGDKAAQSRYSRTGWVGFMCGYLAEGSVQKGCATLK